MTVAIFANAVAIIAPVSNQDFGSRPIPVIKEVIPFVIGNFTARNFKAYWQSHNSANQVDFRRKATF